MATDITDGGIERLLPARTVVRIIGLASQPELNGTHGHTLAYHKEKDRYSVRVVGRTLALRRQNMADVIDCGTDAAVAASTSLGKDAVAAFANSEHELAHSLFRGCIKLDPTDKVAHSNCSASLIALARYEEAVAAAETCIRLDPTYAKAHVRKAIALEKAGRKREAFDTLLRGCDLSAASSGSECARMLERLRMEGERDGWMQFSQESRTEAAFRGAQPHCALCLRQTPGGRPPPETSCGLCGMVQYCSIAHKADGHAEHRKCCAALRTVAMRELWRHNPSHPINVRIEITAVDGGFKVVLGGERSEAAAEAATVRGGGAKTSPAAAPAFLHETGFVSLSPLELRRLDSWPTFFRSVDVQERWLSKRVPPEASADDGGCFGPVPPPSRGSPSKHALSTLIGQEMRLRLADLLSDALTTFFAARQVGGLLDVDQMRLAYCLASSHMLDGGDGASEGAASVATAIAPAAPQIHVLGAEAREEARRATIFQRALRALLRHDQINAVHIGPGLADTRRAAASSLAPADDQGGAAGAGGMGGGAGGAAFFRGSYGDYHQSDAFRPPELIVAFHAGLYVNANGYTWNETLEIAIGLGVTFVVTASTDEDARCTREFLEAFGARVLLDLPNPFASPEVRQVYPCENLTSQRNRHVFAFRGTRDAQTAEASEERTRRLEVVGRKIMGRLKENPLLT
jgi:hypothetical protein